MKKHIFATSLATVFLLLCFVGCSNQGEEGATFSTATDFVVEETELLDNFSLTSDESITIYDAVGDKVLLGTYSDRQPDDPYYSEVGYSSFSKQLFIYNWINESILHELTIPANSLCTNGILTEQGAVCVAVEPDKDGRSRNKILHVSTDGYTEVIFECTSPNMSYYVPQIVSLKDGGFSFSYYDDGENTFGVQYVSSDNKVSPVYISYNEDEFFGTELSTNGTQMLYYATVNGAPSLLLGDNSSLNTIIALEKSQSMHSFGLSENYVFASIQDHSSENRTDKIHLYDMSGNLLMEKPSIPLFGLVSNLDGGVFASDMQYNAYSISPS